MPKENIHGRGRDPSFDLPQYFVQVDGLRTAYADTGAAPKKKAAKKTLLFIHGLAGNAAHWVHVAPAFADDYRVLAIDLPGCGESQAYSGPYSVRTYARHVIHFMDVLGIEKATLIGHSLGGMVSTEIALAAADRVDRLILLNPAGYQKVPLALQTLGYLAIRRGLMNALLPKIYKLILGQVFAQKNEYTEQFIHMVRATYKDEDIGLVSSVIYALRNDFLSLDYTPRLPAIPVPIFFMWGGKDKLVPSERIKATAMTLKNVHAEEIPDCGHMPNIEQPAQVIRFIKEALSQA